VELKIVAANPATRALKFLATRISKNVCFHGIYRDRAPSRSYSTCVTLDKINMDDTRFTDNC
jgi:hypothetical protein